MTEARGKVIVDGWKAQVMNGEVRAVVAELLSLHYDPVYLQSIQRNFVHYANAVVAHAPDRSEFTLSRVAKALLQE